MTKTIIYKGFPLQKCRKCKEYKKVLSNFTFNKLTNAPFECCDGCLRSTKRITRIGKICSKCRKIQGFLTTKKLPKEFKSLWMVRHEAQLIST